MDGEEENVRPFGRTNARTRRMATRMASALASSDNRAQAGLAHLEALESDDAGVEVVDLNDDEYRSTDEEDPVLMQKKQSKIMKRKTRKGKALEISKEIRNTLHIAHEGVDKVRHSKIDLLMAKLNRFVILDGEGPQEMFDRLMIIVGRIRGLGGDEINDHKVVKIMLEAYSPRNETIVTLIRDKKKFEYFTPSDVLGRIMIFDMQREAALERRKLGELQAKLDGMKIKDIALEVNKSTKQPSTSKSKSNKEASTSKPKAPRKVKEEIETTSSSSDDESDGEQYEEIGDVALFMRRFQKGLKKQGYKIVKRRFPNNKKRTCYNCGSTEHFIAHCPYEINDNKYKKDKKESKANHRKSKKYMGEAHIGHEWDLTNDSSSEEDKKVATVAIHQPYSPPRLFNNMSDDDYYSPLPESMHDRFLRTKGTGANQCEDR